MPRRHQRRRVKGWRKPPGARIVDRTSKWGNPYKPGGTGCDVRTMETITVRDVAHAVALHAAWLDYHLEREGPHGPTRRALDEELRGRDLLCFCAEGDPCHGDTLIDRANRRTP